MAKKLSSNLFKVSIAPENGADATTYWLVPSVTQVKRKADGSHLPEYVSCECFSKTGDGNPVSGGGTIKFVLTYKTGSNSAEFVYGSRIIVTSDMAAISFRLYVGGTQVDEKTVSVVEDGQEGLPGPAGVRGRLPFPSGAFDLSTVYTCTDDITPIVYYEAGKTYYTMRKNGNSVGIDPAEDYASNGSDSTWIPFENYKAIFTEILMANFAKLASAVFYGDYMFSQQGIDKRGIATTVYENFGKENFTPNFQVNFKTGEINALKGTFRANVLPTPEVYVLRKADIYADIDISTSINSTLIFFSSNYDVNGNVAVIPDNSIVRLNLDSISQYNESDPHGTLYGKIKIINQSTLTLDIYSSYTTSVSQPFFIFPSKAILAYPGFGTSNLNSGVENQLYLTPGAVLDAYVMRTTQENAIMKVAMHILNPGDFEYKKDPKGLEYILISKGLKID